MALLCGNIDHNTIRMLGQWHSDAMVRYLHLQAKLLMRKFTPASHHPFSTTTNFHPNNKNKKHPHYVLRLRLHPKILGLGLRQRAPIEQRRAYTPVQAGAPKRSALRGGHG
jgi:hypothetical protein